ncbi:MAG: glycosyltransferase [Candidatus Buchananbacteria bacterium]|nr:glycosyltransferase [Candidatus Buchananbacteria bacterium]
MNKSQQLNIVMFNMSKYTDWQKGIANRNYHILHNLAKRDEINKIIAVDFLPFNWTRAIKTYLKDQIIDDAKGSIIYGDLTSRCWQVSSKILVYSSIDSILNKSKITQELKRIIKKEKISDNLTAWNYNPLYVNYFNQLNQALNIFDTVDNWLTHSSYKKYQTKLEKNYRIIKQKSDLIFTVSQNLKQQLFNNQPNTYWLPNGVDLNFFQSINEKHYLLENIPKPIIGFLGILQDRIDLDILLYLAKNNPDKSIVLAGPVWPSFSKNKLQRFKNVYFLGPINHWEIPQLYNGFDVGIIPYKTNDFVKSIDPMKFYEYLAARLPIVTTNVSGIEKFADYINVAKTPEQFNDFVNQAIIADKLNSIYEILKNHTWQKRIEQMLNLIYNKLNY